MWWYQCKKITGRPANTSKTVSNNSGILLSVNKETAIPAVPSAPQCSLRQIEICKPVCHINPFFFSMEEILGNHFVPNSLESFS